MSNSTEQRFITRPEVLAARHTLDASMAAFGQDVARLSPAYDGALFAVTDDHFPNDLGVISLSQAERRSREQVGFTKRSLANRRVQRRDTALDQVLSDHAPLYIRSAMQPERHMTWGARVSKTGRAVVQVALDVQHGMLPSRHEMNEVWEAHAPIISEAAIPLQRLQDDTDNFLGKLELEPATQPNAFAIRWDVTGSTEMAMTKLGTYQAYLDHWKREIERIMQESRYDVFDLGDGQNLVLPLGTKSPFDTDALRRMRDDIVLPLTRDLVTAHGKVAVQYHDMLKPEARFAVSMGNVYPDDRNQKTGLLLYEAARSLKRPDGVLTISPSAQFD